MPKVAPLAIVCVPSVALGLIVAVVLAVVGAGIVPAIVVGIVVAAAVAFWLWRRAPRAALATLGASPLAPGDSERLANVVEGLCAIHGVDQPELHVVESEATNAAVIGRAGGSSHLVVTRGLLQSLDRLELEAVVAREICRIRSGLDASTTLAGVVALLGSGRLAERVVERTVDPGSVTTTDIEAVRLTRYPPALASVLEKASHEQLLAPPPAARHLWLVEPASVDGAGLAQPPLSQRIDVLREM